MTPHRSAVAAIVIAAFALGTELPPAPAAANWLTSILKEAGEAGGKVTTKAGKLGDGALDNVASHIKSLPETPGSVSVAAHVGPEGHWHFANKSGEVYTAGTADELARMPQALAPGSTGKLALYLTPDTIFAQRVLLKDLPKDAELFVVHANKNYRLVARTPGDFETLAAETALGLRVELKDPDLFGEALFQLGQPLKPSSVRVLSLSSGGPDALMRVPKFDNATKSALVDGIDPQSLARALPSVSGQTVVLTGRVDGDVLRVVPGSGPEVALKFDDLKQAADAADVNLVIVRSASARQPGGKNWLWQTMSVSGLDSALKQPTFGDFVAALGTKSGPMSVTATRDSFGRATIRAIPADTPSSPITSTLEDWMDTIGSTVAGNLPVDGIDAHVRDESRQSELDARWIPGIPTYVQVSYLIGILFGLFAFGTSLRWWRRIWPAEQREEYNRGIGYNLARTTRWFAFGAVFLPIAGPFALSWLVLLQIWGIVTAPFRALIWMKNRLLPRAQ